MNLDPHWLEQNYRNESTGYLKTLLFDIETFGGNEMDKQQISAEIERRSEERETVKNTLEHCTPSNTNT